MAITSQARWAELFDRLPEGFRPYGLELAWEHERLWALDLPVEEMAVNELFWQIDLPWWRLGERYFALRPREVLGDPERFNDQHVRTLAADLFFPIEVTTREGRWFILDGVHRLLKAVVLDLPAVRVRKLP